MGAAQPGPTPPRRALDAGWEIAREPAGAWRAIGAPRPVAAVLAESGEWSIDGPARRFDAETWWYRLRFDASAEAARLVFDGLATCCEVFLNGRPVLAARNMFRRHGVEIAAGALRPADNELLIRFDPLDAQLAQRRPRPAWRAPMVEHQQLRWIRTTLLGRTPGWSPAAAIVGPWRGVWLESAQPPAFEVLEHAARLDGVDGLLQLAVRAQAVRVLAVLEVDGRRVEWPLVRDAAGVFRGEGRIAAVPRWWPHTHGEPALHPLALRIEAADGTAAMHPIGPVGFRRIELDRGTDGEGFALVVNGVPVFARGVCWVPLDTLRLHAAPQHLRAMLAALRTAGVNLIRVGGTMVYEDAAFFDACDEAGVMVWQEFMFANMDYPAADPAFAAEVVVEAAEQLALWRGHACVALVCGNSEVAQQAAMWGAERTAWTPALFHETLPALVARALPGVPYWPSSASGGAFPFQPAAGTCSYYGVGAYLRPVEDARQSGLRFASECLAFAQVPDDAGLARLAALQGGIAPRTHQPAWKERVPRDLGAGWDFDDVRDHYLETAFGVAAAEARRGDPADWWARSRAATCETLAAAFTQWRDPQSACRGALVWFLRDLRAGAGWGLFDELGHPKAAFHALARAWQALHLGLVDEGQNGVFVQVVNEAPRALEGRLALGFFARGEIPVGQLEQPLALPAHGSLRASVLAQAPGFLDLNGSYRFGPAAADTIVATLRDAAGATLRETVLFLRPLVAAPLAGADIGLVAEARRQGAGVRVTLRTRAAARAVHFEAPGWRCADEYFDLAPGREREIDFLPVAAAAAPAWYARAGAINARDRVAVPLAEAAA